MGTIKHFRTFVLGLFIFSFFYSTNYAQVGIGTTDPKTTLDVNGALSLRDGPLLTLDASTTNSIDLDASPYSSYRVTSTGDFGIRRIRAVMSSDGQLVTFTNITNFQMTLRDEAVSGSRKIFCPNGDDLVLNGIYTSATLQYNDTLGGWVVISTNSIAKEEPPADSVTLAANYSKSPGSFTDVPGMSLAFVARKSSVLVLLTGSGQSSTGLKMGICDFQVLNVSSSTTIGGTHEKLTTYDNDPERLASAWSLSFTKPLTGLTIGNSYTLKVQAFLYVTPGTGTGNLTIDPVTRPFDHHLTLSVIQ